MKAWNHIGQLIQNAKSHIPTSFSQPSHNILLHSAGYKSEEWSKWISLYSIPLLNGHIGEKFLIFWHKFVEAVSICKKWTITRIKVETL